MTLPGPLDLTKVPDEFSIAMWIMPTDLNAQSYFINMFNRAYLRAEVSDNRVFYEFKTGSGV